MPTVIPQPTPRPMQAIALALLLALLLLLVAPQAQAQAATPATTPTAKEASWTIRDFRFRSGEVLPELRLHYRTLGDPSGEPVLLMHGTTGSGASLLTPNFGGELFGPGQALDITRYYVILPDAIGHGRSSKPSDGLRAAFPKYTYEDLVVAQHRLLTEHLKLV